jgi:hypothetical protein
MSSYLVTNGGHVVATSLGGLVSVPGSGTIDFFDTGVAGEVGNINVYHVPPATVGTMSSFDVTYSGGTFTSAYLYVYLEHALVDAYEMVDKGSGTYGLASPTSLSDLAGDGYLLVVATGSQYYIGKDGATTIDSNYLTSFPKILAGNTSINSSSVAGGALGKLPYYMGLVISSELLYIHHLIPATVSTTSTFDMILGCDARDYSSDVSVELLIYNAGNELVSTQPLVYKGDKVFGLSSATSLSTLAGDRYKIHASGSFTNSELDFNVYIFKDGAVGQTNFSSPTLFIHAGDNPINSASSGQNQDS